jgi:hypothetical protein
MNWKRMRLPLVLRFARFKWKFIFTQRVLEKRKTFKKRLDRNQYQNMKIESQLFWTYSY